VLNRSPVRAAREQSKAWSRSRLGRTGDGARELLPWTAGPGVQKNFDPEHPLARDSKDRSLVFLLYLIQFVSCPSSLALCISHPLPIPRGPPCLRARVNVYECRGGKRSKVSPRGALNLPAARFLQTERFDPLPFPPHDGQDKSEVSLFSTCKLACCDGLEDGTTRLYIMGSR
jgi:hypothetical protein